MTGKTLKGGLLAAALIVVSGCATSTHSVDYAREHLYSGDTAGNVPFVELGGAHSRQRGPVWESCDNLVERALADIREQREARDADAVSSVRWTNHATGVNESTPVCTTRWGWFTALGVGGLHPWVRVAEVQGRLVRTNGDDRDDTRSKPAAAPEETPSAEDDDTRPEPAASPEETPSSEDEDAATGE